MPIEGSHKFKSKRIGMMNRRGRGSHDSEAGGRMDLDDSILPPHIRIRLNDLFCQIEREFENVYAENIALQDKVELLTERLEAISGDKVEQQDIPDRPHTFSQSVKKSGSQISQRLKLTYKTGTSKIVNQFKTASSGSNLIREFRGHRDGVWEVNTAKTDVPIIGTASADHSARIWWVETGTCLLQYLGHTGSVNSIRFHPTLDLAVTGSGDQTAHIWKAAISIPAHMENLKSHSSEDELEGSEREDGDGMDSSEDRHEPTHLKQPSLELQGHSSVIIAADWFSGGSQVITASWDRTANLYDADTGEIVNTLTGHDQELTNVCIHSSQRLVVTSSKDTTFRLWDFRDPAMKVNVFQGHTQQVTTAVFAAGDKVVSGSDDRTVKVWDLKNMRSPITTIRTDSAVNRLSVCPSQNVIAIPHDNRHIRLFDLNGVRVGRLPRSNRQGHSRMVCATAWCDREGAVSNLFSCGFDRQVFGWNVTYQT